MLIAVILFLIPVLLFVVAFLYETFLSLQRLFKPQASKRGYVNATWETTHTLLVAGVIVLVMMFTRDIANLGSAIFLSTFLAAGALVVRAVIYCYIFYVRKSEKVNWVDWLFAASHLLAAVFLVITVLEALWYLYRNNPPANTEFLPLLVPGLVAVIAAIAVPMFVLYKTRD
jgi:cytochrome bd-type quinol oxidase subunit 2